MPNLRQQRPWAVPPGLGWLVLATGFFLAAGFWLCAAGAAEAADPYPGRLAAEKLTWDQVQALPGGQEVLHSELGRQRIFQARSRYVHELLGHRQVSVRSRAWLAARGLGQARAHDPYAKLDDVRTDTLRILLVRISFETNRDPHLVTMAPDGDFFLDPHDPSDPLPIDPTPHDKAYFESHLVGLGEYYKYQSGGRLHIEAQVLPEGDRDSYKLGDVADYGPGDTGFWTLNGLERLVRDMITAADQGTQADGSADLSDYADDRDLTYIIFAHAGSDWQSDINQDTPNDIPTFFVTLGEAQGLIGGGLLSECSVIPETTTQDGYRGSIAAALYHEFGHALGLPDVYDATTGLTSCGVWDLMDSGTNLAATLGYRDPDTGQIVAEPVSGILPPSLSAWCKWFLGWLDTQVIEGGEGRAFELPAVGVPRDQYGLHSSIPGYDFSLAAPQALVGGVSPREFFLVENRWVPLSVDDTPYDPYEPDSNYGDLYFKTDPQTGVVLYLAGDRQGTTGLNTGYYDYFLPDGGLLVWHVNMDRIEPGLASNTINRFGDGLKLIEADGIQDIGVLDAYVLGWYGSARDPFAPWNSVGFTELFTQGAGVPSSRAHDRSWTGLRLWDIDDVGQAHGAVMSLQAVVEPVQAGWPIDMPITGTQDAPAPLALETSSLTPVLGSDGRQLLAASTGPGGDLGPLLMLWTESGAPAYAPGAGQPDGTALVLPGPLAGSPAVFPLADGHSALLVGSDEGTVQALRADAGQLQVVWSVSVGDSLLAPPQPVPQPDGAWLILAIDGQGDGHLLDQAGQAVGEPRNLLGSGEAPLLVAPRVVQLDETSAVLLVQVSGWQLVPLDAAGLGEDIRAWNGRLLVPAAVAVIPGALDHRLLVFGPEGLQGSWLIDGLGNYLQADWPDPGSALVCEPAVADLTGDGRFDLVAATARRLFAWQSDGVPVTGYPLDLTSLFPLPDSTRIAGPLIVADLAGGPGNELAFATAQGHLFVLGEGGRTSDQTPFRFGMGGASGLALIPRGQERASLALGTAGGLVGPPLERRATPGRILLYDDRPLAVSGPATATWQGPGGGPSRLGPVGEPQPVAGAGPVALGQDAVVFYPNPMTDRQLTVRFYSAGDRDAELVIYNLQGEPVLTQRLPAQGGQINEQTLELDVASGLYVARLTCERSPGRIESQVKTVAVVR